MVKYGIGGITSTQTGDNYADSVYHTGSFPEANTSGTTAQTSLYVTQGTSTIDGKSDTIYIGYANQLTVIQQKQNNGNGWDSYNEGAGSAKFLHLLLHLRRNGG